MNHGNRDAMLKVIESQGQISSRFTDLSRIGTHGGDGHFSMVVSAMDQNCGRRVALKFYDPDHLADAYRSSCFQREAEMLEHFIGSPDIIQRVAPLQSFSIPFMYGAVTMTIPFSYYGVELASNNVAECQPYASWSILRKLDTFRAMCRGVQRVHAASVIHRDIKLSNFLLLPDGAIRLCDFGTAKFIYGIDPLRPDYGAPVGDMQHAAPELFAALQDVDSTIDFKADLYSLGTVFFELLTGLTLNSLIFDHATLDALSRTMNAVPKNDRVRIYDSFVSGMAASRPLPDLSSYGVNLPLSIFNILDQLYQDLCAIDYRYRLTDFRTIFSRLTRATLILKNDSAYQAWRKQKRLIS